MPWGMNQEICYSWVHALQQQFWKNRLPRLIFSYDKQENSTDWAYRITDMEW